MVVEVEGKLGLRHRFESFFWNEPSSSRLSPLTLKSANALLSPLGSHPLKKDIEQNAGSSLH